MDTMVRHLIDLFEFNKEANIRLTECTRAVHPQDEIILHLSHLANCQYKWFDRLQGSPPLSLRDWWAPVYTLDELPEHFRESASLWTSFLEGRQDAEIDQEVSYAGAGGVEWAATIRDIALQLNFHSFHHRAQIQRMIRETGTQPPPIDYIRFHSHRKASDG